MSSEKMSSNLDSNTVMLAMQELKSEFVPKINDHCHHKIERSRRFKVDILQSCFQHIIVQRDKMVGFTKGYDSQVTEHASEGSLWL